MITPYKGRTVMPGQKVNAYRNLHNGLWSLMAVDGKDANRVIAHADEVSIIGPVFVVGEAGRQRVIREGKKNVHAFVRGFLAASDHQADVRVTYNPFKRGAFVTEAGDVVREAAFAHLDSNGKAWARGVFA